MNFKSKPDIMDSRKQEFIFTYVDTMVAIVQKTKKDV